MEEKVYRFWLHNLPGVGDRTIEKLLSYFGSAQRACCAPPEEQKQVIKEKTIERISAFNKTFDPARAYEKMQEKNIAFYTIEDKEYPGRLRKIAHPPYALYCLGALPGEGRPAVAVIGARECSEYGSYMAEAFAGKLARAGVSVISGMARGIDGIGQRAALRSGGRTYGVLGCGVDICYPASNRALYQEIADSGGGILSVFPPGREPAKQQFPERNRIVAGLSDLVLVVEARQKSGTWIAVDMALEQGKHVYAVPGRLTDRLSDGCNLLVRQGAGIALSPEDLLAEIALLTNRKELGKGSRECAGVGIGDGKKQGMGAIRYLDYAPKSIVEIMEAMARAGEGRELPDVLGELVGLCMEGRARQVSGTYFAKVAEG